MPEKEPTAEDLQLLVMLPTDRQGQWLDACLLYGGGLEIQTTQVASAAQMAQQLRQYSFDLLCFWVEGAQLPAEDSCRQLSSLAEHSGFAVLGMHAVEGWQHGLIQAGAVACIDMDLADPVVLVHSLRQACELVRLRGERQQWESERRRTQQRELAEVERLVTGQHQLLRRLDQFGVGPGLVGPALPMPNAVATLPFTTAPHAILSVPDDQELLATPLGNSYCGVLQNYLFDETQVSPTAITLLAEHFLSTDLTSTDIMRLHLAAVTRVTSCAGSGALRHCLASADRFLMELLLRVVDRQPAYASPLAAA